MMNIIVNDLKNAPKTLACAIWDKIENGIKLNEKEYRYWLKIKRKNIDKFELIENGCILYYSWGRKYYKNGKLHRDNGPARIWSDGYKAYFLNGKKYSEEEYWKIVNQKSCEGKIFEDKETGKKYKLVDI